MKALPWANGKLNTLTAHSYNQLLGSMKLYCTFLIVLMALSCAAKSQSDADIARALIGTWTDAPSDRAPVHGRVSYYADGHGVELVWPAGQPESAAVRIETHWSVTNSVLIVRSVKSSDPQKVPVGIELRDHIVSVAADQFVFEPEGGYGDIEKKRQTRIRVEQMPNKPAAANRAIALQLTSLSKWRTLAEPERYVP